MRKQKNVLDLQKNQIIAQEYKDKRVTMRELTIKHNVPYQNASIAIKLNTLLDNIDFNNSYLLKEYAVQFLVDKYIEIDTYIINQLQKNREKVGVVSKLTKKQYR